MLTKEVVYDIETLPNLFLCTIYDPNTSILRVFHAGFGWQFIADRISIIWELEEYIFWLKKKGYLMVGFNNYHYDYPVLHYLLNNIDHYHSIDDDGLALCQDVFHFSSLIIEEATKGNRFAHTVWDRDVIVPQLDLFKVHHFDNKAKTVSLKRLEFNMRRRTVLEYTEGFDHEVSSDEEAGRLIDYNIEDVMATYQFRLMSAEQVDFRKSLVNTWGIEVLNYNDTKIGEKLIERRLKEEVGLSALYTYKEGEYGETVRTMKQTPRTHVDLRDIIFPNVKFEAKKLRDLLKYMKTLRVFVDGTRFEWSDKMDYRDGQLRIMEAEDDFARAYYPRNSDEWKAGKAQIAALKKEYADHDISLTYHGATFELGKGGIHSAVPWGAYRSGNGRIILDVDVASFYPSIAIEYQMKPEHLPDEYIEIYAGLKRERMAYKKTDPARAKMLKLALNGTYGKTNSIYSVLYDPEYSLKTVINGQLFLLMLWDMLVQALPTIELIQANTDGITVMIEERNEQTCVEIMSTWEQTTRMELESVHYESMFVRDVNNYVARDTKGKTKAKGAYNWMELYTGSVEGVVWHKNHSNVVSQMAACSYLLDGVDIEEFIRNHKDIYDFFLCSNVNRSSRLYWGGEEIQRNSRYLITNTGNELIKVMPPLKGKTEERRIAVNKGKNTLIFNEVPSDLSLQDCDIDYGFYVEEANKLVEGFKL